MNYLLSGLLIAMSLTVICLMLYSIKTKSAQIALLYLLFFCVSIYSVGYSLELLSDTMQQMIFCNFIQFIGIPFIPALWLIYVLSDVRYSNKYFLNPIYTGFILFTPLLCFVVRLTNSMHHLYYTSYKIEVHNFPILILNKGPFFYILILYSILCIVLSNIILFKSTKKNTSFVAYRSRLMMFIMIMPSAVLIIKLFGFIPMGVDLVPFSFLLSLLLFLKGFRKYYLLDEKGMLIDELQANGNILIHVLEAIDNVIILFDNMHKKVWLMNDTYAQIFGEPLDRNVKRAVDQILERVHPDDKEQVEQELAFIKRASYAEVGKFDYRMCNKNNEYIWVRSNIRPIASYSRKESLVLFNINNINEERKTLEALTKRAEIDVTGVYNRATAFEKIKQFLSSCDAENKSYALLLFDIDNLKKINDSCGHCTGDLVIDGFVQILRGNIQEKSILGRLGGDEFIAFIWDVPSKRYIEERLKNIMKKSNELQQKFKLPLSVSVSVGIAQSTENMVTLEELYENADIALYEVKGNKNNFCFYDSICPANHI